MSYFTDIIKKGYVYIIAIFILFLTVLIINNLYINELTIVDNEILAFININLQSNFLTGFMKFITFFGSYKFLISLAILMFLVLKNKNIKIFTSFNLLLVYLTNVILKHIYLRERPDFTLVSESGYSLPSSHAMCSMAFYGLLIYFVKKYIKNKYFRCIFIIILSLLVLLIGFSRIYLNVHYLSDVIIGYLFGLLSLLLFVKINGEEGV